MTFAPSPAELGYRLPAEWEPHAATWLAWPHRQATWLGDFSPIPHVFENVARLLALREPVKIIATGESLKDAQQRVGDVENIECIDIPTNDSWLRDTGPVFLVPHSDPSLPTAAITWKWNAWGGKYPPWDDDARVASAIASIVGLPHFEPDIVLEGGAIETDGKGTLLVNKNCVVDEKRNTGLSQNEMERILIEQLGIEKVIWAGGSLQGDDTDGHIDQLARFVTSGHVVVARQPDSGDPNHAALNENVNLLREATDAKGDHIELTMIDIPPCFTFEGVQLP
ncbi:MAG: agmatine deiminase family protein, partial [Pirellulales bacterium]